MMKRDDFAPAGPDEWAAGMLSRLTDWARSPWGVRSLAVVGVLAIYLVFWRSSPEEPRASAPIEQGQIEAAFVGETEFVQEVSAPKKSTLAEQFVAAVNNENRGIPILIGNDTAVGDVGRIGSPVRVIQVISDGRMLVDATGKTIILEADTNGIVDDSEFTVRDQVIVRATEQYKAVSGATRTVFVLAVVPASEIGKVKGGPEASKLIDAQIQLTFSLILAKYREVREWTHDISGGGRKIRRTGFVVSLNDDEVEVKQAGKSDQTSGLVVTMSLNRISETDRSYLREWKSRDDSVRLIAKTLNLEYRP
jgi:hypothetical protein